MKADDLCPLAEDCPICDGRRKDRRVQRIHAAIVVLLAGGLLYVLTH